MQSATTARAAASRRSSRSRGSAVPYAELDALIQSGDWLALLTRITGIPGLLYDPYYLGGGTHENRSGQGLDPHVDFNYHPSERWHRRLNLIVYLNRAWDAVVGRVASALSRSGTATARRACRSSPRSTAA